MRFGRKARLCVALALVILFLYLAVGATVDGYERYESGSFGADSSYYFSFAARLFNDQLDDLPVGQAEGMGIFLLAGREGGADIQKNLHFEPVAYLTVGLYKAIPSPVTLIAFYAVLFFSPLLYGAWLIAKVRISRPEVLLGVLLFYALYPTAIARATDDIRPFILLFPFLMLAMLSVLYERSRTEKLLFFNLLLVVREEALVFTLAIILHQYFQERRTERAHGVSALLVKNWAAWFVLVVGYAFWIRPAYVFNSARLSSVVHAMLAPALLPFAISLFAFLLCIIILFRATRADQRRNWIREYSEHAGFFMCAIAPPVLLIVFGFGPPILMWQFFGNRAGMIAIVFLLAFVLSIAVSKERERYFEPYISGLAITLLMLGGVFALGEFNSYQAFTPYRIELAHKIGRPVSRLRGTVTRDTPVLLDYVTAEFFYDFAHTSVLRMYPDSDSLVDPEDFYPRSIPTLVAALRGGTTYAVIIRAHEGMLADIAKQARKKLIVLDRSGVFVTFRVEDL